MEDLKQPVVPSTEENTVKKPKKKTRPTTDADIIARGNFAKNKLEEVDLHCNNVSPASMETHLTTFYEAYVQKDAAKFTKSNARIEAGILSKQFDEAVSALKGILRHNYSVKEAVALYPEFGIDKDKSKNYRLDGTEYAKLADLEKMTLAVKKYDIQSDKCGLEFWEPKIVRYKELVDVLVNKAGNISEKVATKTQMRRAINDDFNSIIYLIKCNYPKDEVPAMLRAFGFQKERY